MTEWRLSALESSHSPLTACFFFLILGDLRDKSGPGPEAWSFWKDMFPQDFLLKISFSSATEPAYCGQSLADATVTGGEGAARDRERKPETWHQNHVTPSRGLNSDSFSGQMGHCLQ